jgi:hypothetical protein
VDRAGGRDRPPAVLTDRAKREIARQVGQDASAVSTVANAFGVSWAPAIWQSRGHCAELAFYRSILGRRSARFLPSAESALGFSWPGPSLLPRPCSRKLFWSTSALYRAQQRPRGEGREPAMTSCAPSRSRAAPPFLPALAL